MPAVTNPIALACLIKARQPARKSHEVYDSRTADKFVIRGYEELFSALSEIGKQQGRSINSECIAAITDALGMHKSSTVMLRMLKAHFEQAMVDQIFIDLPVFELSMCKNPSKFIIRLPEHVRATIRDGVVDAVASQRQASTSMNQWVLRALVSWVNYQRKHFALHAAAMALDT